MKQIRIITGTLEVGGTEMHLLQVLPKLVTLGWCVKVIVLDKPGALQDRFRNAGVVVLPIISNEEFKRLQKWPRLIARLYRLLLVFYRLGLEYKKDPDTLIHSFLPEAYLMSMLAAWVFRFKGLKVMSRRSLSVYQKRRWGFAWIEKFLHPQMQLILGNSYAVIQQLIEEGVGLKKLRLIYNGLDLTNFLPKHSKMETRQALGVTEDCLIIITTANLIPYKGHKDILSALYKIKEQLSKPWKLLCVGRDGGIQSKLHREAEAYGIADNILWLGLRSDVPDLLQCADLAVLASHEEGFPNALLEYMSFGLPIIATAVGGAPEAILHGNCGLIVPPKDPNALAQAILELVEDKNKAAYFGEQARIRVTQEFSLEDCVQRYVCLYDSLIEGSVPAAKADFTFNPQRELAGNP